MTVENRSDETTLLSEVLNLLFGILFGLIFDARNILAVGNQNSLLGWSIGWNLFGASVKWCQVGIWEFYPFDSHGGSLWQNQGGSWKHAHLAGSDVAVYLRDAPCRKHWSEKVTQDLLMIWIIHAWLCECETFEFRFCATFKNTELLTSVSSLKWWRVPGHHEKLDTSWCITNVG